MPTEEKIKIPDSTQYYNTHAQSYFDATILYDFSQVYDLFLHHLPKGAQILDAGCGSGRDSLHFIKQGYNITAFDGSQNMVALARQYTGLPVQHKAFADFDEKETFDGIWSSASLLHVPKAELLSIFVRLKAALKSGGVWYLSFRYGEGEKYEENRYFNDQTESSLKTIIENSGGMEILYLGIPESLRSRRGFQFVAAVVRKS